MSLVAVGAAVALVPGALTAHGGEQPAARDIGAACSQAVQEASPKMEHPIGGFDDTEGNVHQAAINCLIRWDIARGRDGAYLPGEAVRRDQMASFLARMVRPTDDDLPENESAPFTDVDGNVHEANIARLAEAGVVKGRGDGTYGPDERVSRAAMASFVARTLETVTGAELAGEEDSSFADTGGSVHEGHIDALAELGIVQGRGEGTYAPDEAVRRDQMASFLTRSMDYLAAQGHWPVPSSVDLEPAEDTNPANFLHRLRGTVFDQWGEQEPQHGVYAADVRVEVYREVGDGYDLVHTEDDLSGLGGDVRFDYNAGATAGDHDVVVACPLTAEDNPDPQAQWCADVKVGDGEAAVVADDDRGAQAVTVSWTNPVPVEPASDGFHPGTVLAHDSEQGTVDLQTAEQPDGEGERLLRMAYHGADGFTVVSPEAEDQNATVDEFACALRTTVAPDEGTFPHLTARYRVEGESLFELSTPADVGHCLSTGDQFSREERASEGFPAAGTTQLTNVRTAIHDDYDRVLFDLAEDPVSWQVTWEEEPIRLDPSGRPVDVDGEAFLKVHLTASARDAQGEMTYDGPDRIQIDGNVATEAVMTSDHHGGMIWVVGLERETPFRVEVLGDPQHLLLDMAS